MGGSIEYVWRDGSRLTPWMLYVINRASAELYARFGCELLVTSGIRTHQEQIKIFLDKYRVQWVGSGPYKDVRWWKGKRYVRVKGGGTVAPPGKSNHEIQGTKAATDLRDSGRDAGVSRGGNARADWLRANARRLGLIPSGYGFGEPWHYDIPDIFRTPPATPAGGNAKPIIIPAPEPEEEDEPMKYGQIHTTRPDGKMLRRALYAPGTAYFAYWDGNDATLANALATQFETGSSQEVSYGVFEAFQKAAADCAARKS